MDRTDHHPPTTAVVFSGGDTPRPPWRFVVPDGALVIAADSGVDHALAGGVVPAVAIGDFDSVSATGLAAVRDAGGEVVRHRTDKDATDLELALAVAVGRGVSHVVVVAAADGRLDHLVASLVVLAHPSLAAVAVTAHLGDTTVVVARPGLPAALSGTVGQLASLLAVGSTARAVTTTGLAFALCDDDLEPFSARGISNQLTAARATVTVGDGVVLAVLPDAGSGHSANHASITPPNPGAP
jgi:thiamine pyrophosphokinase